MGGGGNWQSQETCAKSGFRKSFSLSQVGRVMTLGLANEMNKSDMDHF